MASYRQDRAPPGGYGPIEWAKKVKPRGVSGYAMFLGFGAFSLVGGAVTALNKKRIRKQELELIEARISVEPLMQAEKDRLFLKQCRKNRDDENELMKDVPGWETGTLYGKPVYHNKYNRWMEPDFYEYYAHVSPKTLYKRQYERLKH
ncbi:NADH dehydrogenase [ubiquinone] 1 alpha subcomplex subunit 13-like [Lineus longissimus]|uniref:NADH dehydrogenase [ubiquinone] 1 alpha subcomplex subunit 13-like n=1 Tax=Lineus longissimus TaxID=88925 RepID=UPI002B4CD35F